MAVYHSHTQGTLYGPAADFAREREAEAERDQAARGGSPLYRKLGAFPLGNDFTRAYRMAGRGGAGPRGTAATSTMDRVNAIDAKRDIYNYSQQLEDREFAANRARAEARAAGTSAASGGGVSASASGVLDYGNEGPKSYAPSAASPAPAAGGGGIANATGVAGGSPMQTAAYNAGLAKGPSSSPTGIKGTMERPRLAAGPNAPGSGANGRRTFEDRIPSKPVFQSPAAARVIPQSEASKRMGGFASDRMMQGPKGQPYDDAARARGYDPENDLDAAMLSGMSRQMQDDPSAGITLGNADMQRWLMDERGSTYMSEPPGMYAMGTGQWSEQKPDPRAADEAMAAMFGSYDPFDATGGNRERRASIPGQAEREAGMLRAAMASDSVPVRMAAEQNIRRVEADAEAAAAIQDAITRQQQGLPSKAEEAKLAAAMEESQRREAGLTRREAIGALTSTIRAKIDSGLPPDDPSVLRDQERLDSLLAESFMEGDSGGAAPAGRTIDMGPADAGGGDWAEEHAALVRDGISPAAAAKALMAEGMTPPEGWEGAPAPAAAQAKPQPVMAEDRIQSPPPVEPGTPAPPERKKTLAERRAQWLADEQAKYDALEEERRIPERRDQARRIREQRAAGLPYDPSSIPVPWHERIGDQDAVWRMNR